MEYYSGKIKVARIYLRKREKFDRQVRDDKNESLYALKRIKT